MWKFSLKFILPWRVILFATLLVLPSFALAQEDQHAQALEQAQHSENTLKPSESDAAAPVVPDSSTAGGPAPELAVTATAVAEPTALVNATEGATDVTAEAKQEKQAQASAQASAQAPKQAPEQAKEQDEEVAGQASAQATAQTAKQVSEQADPLPLWIDGDAKKAIIDFVEAAVTPGSGFIEPENRIAAFDNDGTLIPEYPAYFQLLYGMERLKAAAPNHPEWENEQIYKELLRGDLDKAMALNAKKAFEILIGITAKDSPQILASDVKAWLKTDYPDSRFDDRSFSQMTYAPMLELLAYLKANNFKVYLVTGSEVEFSRALAADLYGLPPDQVIGSQLRQKFEVKNGTNQLVREARLDMINDGLAKPENLQARLGRAPVMAFGNSDGDLPMLQWVTGSPGPRLGLILHHTDAEREYAYDKKAVNGKLRKALSQAKANKWIVVDMKDDWSIVFND